MTQQRRRAWAYLSRVIEGPSRNLQQLFDAGREPEAIAQAVRCREGWIGGLLAETETRYTWDRADDDLAIVQRNGGRMICPDDDEWPAEVFDSAFGFASSGWSEHTRSYQSDAVPPHVLWVRGGNLRQLSSHSVAIVGTRAASNYGVQATRMISAGLLDHQYTLISGGALGVDTVAHSEALTRGGSTIIVQACGLDKKYPAKNSALFDAAATRDNCAIVSEYPPELSPQRHRFLTRNRLVAALSQGTVVTEAAWRSGALNTLSWAAAFGRVAMAVPGPITTSGSLGCHERIRRGDAEMVCSAEEVRELVSKIGEVDVGGQYEIDFAASPIQKLSRNEMRVFDVTGPNPVDSMQIAQGAGLPVKLTVFLLMDLSRQGLIERVGNGWCRRVSDENSGTSG
ncbi:DNA protecting protein DprA [Corynebacterium mustelae]|uniref:DNA protecting protein DprA n=1 Tax=Corynebacterium mustelae TaxID=571915 RepID=A0A0G3H349_9CORY|nr:DNA-processing protein DprA [Corynebacterium mustelae]AKK06228.1 DNA protecting protein DprA [Corynebacterium mustelae]